MSAKVAVNPNIHFGEPCVAGTRIPVQSVLELVREGVSFEEITRITTRTFRPKIFVPAFNTPLMS